MKNVYKLSCVFILFTVLFALPQAKASHSVAGDITYKCLGGNSYKVTLSFYRDCAGIAAPLSVTINVESASCGQALTVVCSPRPGTGIDITPVCNTVQSKCNGGPYTGLQEWIYDGVITLPSQCPDWTFSYLVCCRNPAITTLVSPSSSTFYIYSTLNNTVSPCNSSPVFSNRPVPFICLNQQYCFNNGAMDPDGDSLVYELITPLKTATASVVYQPGYSANQPLSSSPPVSFNTSTGDICMNPQLMEITVLALRVLEYRNGVLIGSILRDVQITVMNCANNLPVATGINGTNNYSITACANTPTCFTINSSDIDTMQQITMSWNQGIPNATFNTTTGTKNPVGTFCWTPTSADVGRSYNFTVQVVDNACPYIGSQVYSYTINVAGIDADAGPDQQVSCIGLATLNAGASGGTGSYSYSWSNGATSQSITAGTGSYTVTVTDGVCSATDGVNLTAAFAGSAAFTASTPYCYTLPVNFQDQSSGAIANWHWDFGDGDTSIAQSPTHQYAAPGTYSVALVITSTSGCNDTSIQVLQFLPKPVAAFSGTTACAGVNLCFSNMTTGAGSWLWNFGDNTSSVLQNPCHTYSAAGTYSVKLRTMDSTSCPDSVTQIITINAAPSFNISATSVCVGNATALTANVTAGSIATYVWDSGNGTNSAASSPLLTYTTAGTYSVSLTATGSNGCSASATTTATVYSLPSVNAGADQSVCSGISATLNASSGATAYLWTPGNSTTQSLSVNPSATTDYILAVTDANGCVNKDTVQVVVNTLPTVSAGADQTLCEGTPASISASGAVSYLWVPGNSTASNLTVTPAVTTAYYVTGTDANGCLMVDTVEVIVNALPVVNMPPKTICGGNSATLNANNAGSSFLWSNGETTQAISVIDSGNYSVLVTTINGCAATGNVHVAISTSAPANPVSVAICQGQSAALDAGNAGGIYSWSTGETTQIINATTSGVYTVAVDNGSGCTSTFSDTLTVNPLPSVGFSTTAECIGNPNAFINQSSISSGSISSSSWNFGDGSNSPGMNPNHTYAAAGTYSVTLTATSSSGCAFSSASVVTIHPKPVANFTSNSVCLKQSTPFNDLSSIANGSIASWNWSFGDNSTSNTASASHSYASAGTYSVQLTATSQFGCTDSITQPVVVKGLPTPAFAVTNGCQNTSLMILNTSSSNNGTIASTNWNFGNGSTSSSLNPSYAYNTSGWQTIQLVVTSSLGCSDTLVKQVEIYPLPVADFTPSKVCEQQAVPFTNLSTVSQGTISSYAWTFGDGSSSTLINPSHTYQSSNNFQVRLIAISNNGCRDTSIRTVTLYPVPVSDFKLTNACQNIALGFFDSSSVSSGNIDAWAWTFGDGATSTSANPTHLYASAGSYSVNLTVTTVNGCSAISSGTATVYEAPKASFTCTEPCFGTPVQFFNQSVMPGNGSLTQTWNFSSGNTTSASNPTFNFASAGTYPVTLTVTSSNGCTHSVTKPAVVHQLPTANFATIGKCLGTATNFQDQSVSTDGAITSWNWDFGDTNTSTFNSPDHLYNNDGEYDVKITVTSSFGCSGNTTQQISVHPNPVVIFTGGGQGCAVFNAHFKDSSSVRKGAITAWLWDFGDGSVSTDQQPQHEYNKSGSYPVTLTVETDKGCYASEMKPGFVFALPTPYADLSTDKKKATSINPIFHFKNISQDYATYEWSFGDGSTESGILNPTHTYPDTGKYTAQLVVTNVYGCRDTVLQVLEIDSKSLMTIPNAFSPNDDGTNDVFKPYFTQMRDVEVQIYNRWGELVKDWHGLNGSWDGTFKGEVVKSDAYVYQIKGTGEDNKNYEWTGSVSVIR